jgi:hypothetical protein
MMTAATRREFFNVATATTAGLVCQAGRSSVGTACPAATSDDSQKNSKRPWYRDAYRRAVIDMHIPDWQPEFLSEFDPKEYARRLVQSRAQSIVCYCQSHVGLFNFPTKVGRQHRGLKGRNALAEMVSACHDAGIAVVLYTSLIFDRWAGDSHPEWRMRTWDGKIQGEGGRHAVLCVNSPYREYVRRFVAEICDQFDFEGIRFDMTFWPWLCYCQHCRKRFADEVGGDLPTTVNWLDERWVAFQRCRERWLVEFAAVATETVRRHKPTASVEHQASTYPLHWMFGVTESLTRQNDFLQGDFYGDQLQGSFVRKLLEDLTPNRPFGYETSFSVALRDHTAMKSEALLEAKASAAIADAAAFIFIDAIDPIGTVNYRAHERMGRVFDRLMPCYAELGGERVADVAIYYSLRSKFNFAGNGRHVSSPDTSDAHTESSMAAARWLISRHLPFRVMTRLTPDSLRSVRVLVLSNVNMMDAAECDVIRNWVREGGAVYASGGSSLVDTNGRRHKDLLLSDVFGVSVVTASWQGRPHYLAPTAAGQPHFPEFTSKYPAFTTGYGFEVKAHADAQVLAVTTLPWPAPDPTQFSSIHSDPPWTPTNNPEVVFHRFGKGRAVYCSSLLETIEGLGETLVRLIRLLGEPFVFEIDAHPAVEATLFHQPDRKRYLLSLVNFQKEMPNVPIDGISVRLRLPRRVGGVALLPQNRSIPIKEHDGRVTFTAPRLDTLAMFAIAVQA